MYGHIRSPLARAVYTRMLNDEEERQSSHEEVRPFIFYLLFNEHLQSKARVGGRNKNKNQMCKLTFLDISL